MFTCLLDAAIPVCRTPEERIFVQRHIADFIIAYPHISPSNDPDFSKKLIAECLERLRYEGNTHLLGADELAPILQGLQCRVEKMKLRDQSRIRKGIYQIGERWRLGRLLYPRSPIRRAVYQIRHLFELFGKASKLFPAR